MLPLATYGQPDHSQCCAGGGVVEELNASGMQDDVDEEDADRPAVIGLEE